MRYFSSYGPVDPRVHFALGRPWLVDSCVAQLVGSADEPGHFFTVHAPRQTGKTWLMHRAVEEIRARHQNRFLVGAQWEHVFARAQYTERNNNILNLVAKARQPFAREVQTLFTRSDVQFVAGQPWCDHLDLHGIITAELVRDERGQETFSCRFASPFVQRCPYNAFSMQLQELLAGVPALDGADTLEDVFTPGRFDAAALLQRYKAHLDDLRERGRDPFHDQPMRADFQLPEAVGHFHLYAWLLQAVGRECIITPEFPTGNGKVDLRIIHRGQPVLVEVKSLAAARELPAARSQAARYARQLGLAEATLAVFLPTRRPEIVAQLEGAAEVEGVRVHVVAVSWRP